MAWSQTTGFGASLARLMSGTLVAETLGILSVPILTRLYDCRDFGILGIFYSVCGIVTVCVTGRYDRAIVKARNFSDAQHLFLATITLCVALVTVLTGGLFLLVGALEFLEPVRELGSLAWLLPLAVCLRASYFASGMLATREEAYGWVGIAEVVRRVTEAGLRIGLALSLHLGAMGLILGTIFGDFLCIVSLVPRLRLGGLFSRFDASRVLPLLREHANFPKYALPSQGLANLRIGMPVFLIATFFGTAEAGFYELARRVLLLPRQLLARKFQRVFYQKAAARHNKGEELSSLVERSVKGLSLFGLPAFLMLALAGGPLFSQLFGASWRASGVYCQILVPAGLFGFLAQSVTLFNALGKQAIGLWWNLLATLLCAAGIVLGGVLGGPLQAIVCMSATMTLAYVANLGLTMRFSKASWRSLLSSPILARDMSDETADN